MTLRLTLSQPSSRWFKLLETHLHFTICILGINHVGRKGRDGLQHYFCSYRFKCTMQQYACHAIKLLRPSYVLVLKAPSLLSAKYSHFGTALGPYGRLCLLSILDHHLRKHLRRYFTTYFTMLRTLLASALAFFLAFFISRLPSLSLDAFSSNNSQNQLTTLWLQVLKQLHLVAKDGLTIELDYGYFRGKEEDGVQMWLGIPYAQDPYVSLFV